MTLRSKLNLMFLGALQVTFLTAVFTFWAVQRWRLLADDLTLIQDQNVRLEHVIREAARGAVPNPRKLRDHAQNLDSSPSSAWCWPA